MRINSVNFCGVRKVVDFVKPAKTESIENLSAIVKNWLSQPLKADTFTSSKKMDPYSVKRIRFFNKDKQVGLHYELIDGSYAGSRVFSNGIKIKYIATGSIEGQKPSVVTTYINGKGLIGGRITSKAYDAKGHPLIPTLKEINRYIN